MHTIRLGLLLALILLFDPRVFYLMILTTGLYFLVMFEKKFLSRDWVLRMILLLVVIVSVHLFWIIPGILYKGSVSQQQMGGVEGFQFLSFGGFDYALSWLHPNWPENIFGKRLFLNPFFLLFPLLAFASLLFLKKSTEKILLFFVILSLVAAFLAKGAKEPFSGVNIFLFQYLPGMGLFRDTSKFYILISLAYSVLITYSLSAIARTISKRIQHPRFVTNACLLLFCLFVLTLLSPIVGSSKKILRPIPSSYTQFATLLSDNNAFSRSLWLPEWQRFGYFSDIHPAIGRNELIKDSSVRGVKNFFAQKSAESIIKAWSIQYIVIPDDTEKEIFLTDRTYSQHKKDEYVRVLDSVAWLKKDSSFSPLLVYKVKMFRPHFSSESGANNPLITKQSPSEYELKAQNGTISGKILFSEAYDPYWIARVDKTVIIQSRAINGMNSFSLPNGSKEVVVEYQPQKMLNIFFVLSLINLSGWIVFLWRKKTYV